MRSEKYKKILVNLKKIFTSLPIQNTLDHQEKTLHNYLQYLCQSKEDDVDIRQILSNISSLLETIQNRPREGISGKFSSLYKGLLYEAVNPKFESIKKEADHYLLYEVIINSHEATSIYLTNLHISEEQFSCVAYTKYPALKFLKISMFFVDGKPFYQQKEEFYNQVSQTVEVLDLSGNQIGKDINAIAHIANFIKKFSNLTKLILSNNWIDESILEMLFSDQSCLPMNIEFLDLSFNFLTLRKDITFYNYIGLQPQSTHPNPVKLKLSCENVDISANYTAFIDDNNQVKSSTEKYINGHKLISNKKVGQQEAIIQSLLRPKYFITSVQWVGTLAYNAKERRPELFIQGMNEHGELFLEQIPCKNNIKRKSFDTLREYVDIDHENYSFQEAVCLDINPQNLAQNINGNVTNILKIMKFQTSSLFPPFNMKSILYPTKSVAFCRNLHSSDSLTANFKLTNIVVPNQVVINNTKNLLLAEKTDESRTRMGLAMSNSELIRSIRIPATHKPGNAVHDGGCFFDSLAQILNKIRGDDFFTEKKLRQNCYKYYSEHRTEVNTWNQKDGGNQNYSNIRYTQPELENLKSPFSVVWGRPLVEGRILCKVLGIPAIRWIEIIIDPDNNKNPVPHFFQVTQDSEKETTISQDSFFSYDIPILAVGQKEKHFIPILPQTGNFQTIVTNAGNNTIQLIVEHILQGKEVEPNKPRIYLPKQDRKNILEMIVAHEVRAIKDEALFNDTLKKIFTIFDIEIFSKDKDKNGNTILHRSIINGHHILARFLIAYGANLRISNNAGLFPALLAKQICEESGSIKMTEIAKTLNDKRMDENIKFFSNRLKDEKTSNLIIKKHGIRQYKKESIIVEYIEVNVIKGNPIFENFILQSDKYIPDAISKIAKQIATEVMNLKSSYRKTKYFLNSTVIENLKKTLQASIDNLQNSRQATPTEMKLHRKEKFFNELFRRLQYYIQACISYNPSESSASPEETLISTHKSISAALNVLKEATGQPTTIAGEFIHALATLFKEINDQIVPGKIQKKKDHLLQTFKIENDISHFKLVSICDAMYSRFVFQIKQLTNDGIEKLTDCIASRIIFHIFNGEDEITDNKIINTLKDYLKKHFQKNYIPGKFVPLLNRCILALMNEKFGRDIRSDDKNENCATISGYIELSGIMILNEDGVPTYWVREGFREEDIQVYGFCRGYPEETKEMRQYYALAESSPSLSSNTNSNTSSRNNSGSFSFAAHTVFFGNRSNSISSGSQSLVNSRPGSTSATPPKFPTPPGTIR